MNPVIRNRYTGAIIYEGEAGMTTRQMLEKAITAKANLYGANLRGADLRGADLGEKFGKLLEGRSFFQCGPIGSRSDCLLSFLTDKGIIVKAGCFMGTLDEFREKVASTHDDNDHAKEYEMAMLMIEAHAAIWGAKP